jgi:hypothetical protein
MLTPIGKPRQEEAFRRPLPLERPPEQCEELVEPDHLREIQDGVLAVVTQGPPELVDPGVEVAAAAHRHTTRRTHGEVPGQEHLERRRR